MFTSIGRTLEFVAWVGLFWFAIAWAMTQRRAYGVATVLALLGGLWRHLPWLFMLPAGITRPFITQNVLGMAVFGVLVVGPWCFFVADEIRRGDVMAGWRKYLGISKPGQKRR